MIYEFFRELKEDMFGGMSQAEIIKSIICSILALVVIWGLFAVSSAYEDHIRCLNGATQYCIESDFNK